MSVQRLREFVENFTRLLETRPSEDRILVEGRQLVATLVAVDDWLPDQFAQPHPQHYQQYLLYTDPLDRLSIVSFVWGPGQKTAIGDVHEVANALANQASISIHVCGRNIGRVKRHIFDPATGAAKDFVSGYASAVVPNLWI
jgi:3-mercaptopropionate dioxygenase